jgi:hypothetical protein
MATKLPDYSEVSGADEADDILSTDLVKVNPS